MHIEVIGEKGFDGMKEKVFVKKNIFTCVMFGAIFLFILYESITLNTDLSILAFFIAIPTFFLSFIKLIVDISEDINDRITRFLKYTEESNDDDINWEILSLIRDNDESDISEIVEEYCIDKEEYGWVKDTLFQYHNARVSRKKVHMIRRFFLYIYYFIFMLLFLLLLLHSELAIVSMSGIFKNIDLNFFTIWSLIIVLLEIMMKDIFEDFVIIYLDKKMGTNLEWY